MKKNYLKPSFEIINLQMTGMICTSNVTSIAGGEFTYGGAGTGSGDSEPRARFFDGLMIEEETTAKTSTVNEDEDWEDEEQ